MKGDYQAARLGGYRVLLEEVLVAVTTPQAIFADAPALTCGVTLTFRGGPMTIAWAGGGPGGVSAGVVGNDYAAGTYDEVMTSDQLQKVKAIGVGVTSGWITYWGIN